MKIISIVGQKGGIGKSTIAGNLAVLASKKYKKVAIADVDPQGTLANWYERRKNNAVENGIAFIPLEINNLEKIKSELANKGCEILIIDTLPIKADYMEKIIALSDLVVMPCKPSLSDLETMPRTIEQVQGKAGMVFIINESKNNTNVLTQTMEALQRLGAIVGRISSSVEMSTSWSEGLSICEYNKNNTCCGQYHEIFKNIDSHLNKTLHKLSA